MARALTAKQAAFVSHFVEVGNGAEAARRAGYSPKFAEKTAAKLVGNEAVSAAIARARTRLEAKTDISKEWLLEQLAEVVRNGKDQDRIAAAREINKMLGYLAPTRTEHTGADGGPIEHVVPVVIVPDNGRAVNWQAEADERPVQH